jgi:hypothetical protein
MMIASAEAKGPLRLESVASLHPNGVLCFGQNDKSGIPLSFSRVTAMRESQGKNDSAHKRSSP